MVNNEKNKINHFLISNYPKNCFLINCEKLENSLKYQNEKNPPQKIIENRQINKNQNFREIKNIQK